MERDYIISVAMATYNGENYIKEQIKSILNNLNKKDELIISDDGSTDKTIDIINSFNDKRIKLIVGPKKGIKQNFANAIKNCSGKYIFLSDQDDIWMKDKVDKVLTCFKNNNNIKLVIHDCNVIDKDLNIIENSFFKLRNSKAGILKNIWKNSYIGCCMAFDSKLKNNILPIPNNIEMHDQWIGIIAEKSGGSLFINDKLISYRRHDNNVSSLNHHKFNKMIKNRICFVINLFKSKNK